MGKYSDLFDKKIEVPVEITEKIIKISIDEIKDKIREFGYKIKLIVPTKFGTQLDLYSNIGQDIEDFLSSSKVQYKVNKNSIFIEI